ncbi:hypothetical protein QAD02_023535 [Eretmocerus hayati]|uniref:Uncharacterized protein n=1 Tax=Eretmocerus hayati TaxID=131215 RepID=A0ACC2PW38_9HYME|nr:hypothetical protein QAD02_023535 [Eretmocerus hayati]
MQAQMGKGSNHPDGLPKHFVSAMRTLFDIMDDQGTGYVSYADIEARWRPDDGSSPGLPRGVLDALKKCSPPNGLLSFDRFCAGLKICLLSTTHQQPDTSTGSQCINTSLHQVPSEVQKQQQQQQQLDQMNPSSGHMHGSPSAMNAGSSRPPSAPMLDPGQQPKPPWTSCSPNTAAIRPNNVISQQRTLSMPQLQQQHTQPVRKSLDGPGVPNYDLQQQQLDPGMRMQDPKLIKVYGPPKPPRTGAALDSRILGTAAADRSFDKSEIRTALQNWQMGIMMGEKGSPGSDKRQLSDQGKIYRSPDSGAQLIHHNRMLGDGKAIDMHNAQQLALQMQSKKSSSSRRREPRRHTLQNGIDYNMMKRVKQIEQEKDILLQGLAAVEKARDWYLKQLSITQEKIRHLGRMGSHVEPWTESQQEKLELQKTRVLEVNKHLAALISSWDRGGLPLHMNLAFLSTPPPAQMHQDMMTRLKQQNHRLNEELGKKSHRIAMLEQEKDGLVRELYDRQTGIVQSRRSTMIHEQHDQTFM